MTWRVLARGRTGEWKVRGVIMQHFLDPPRRFLTRAAVVPLLPQVPVDDVDGAHESEQWPLTEVRFSFGLLVMRKNESLVSPL